MPSSLVRRPWSVVRSTAVLSAALLLFLSPAIGQQQETKPGAKDQKGKPAPTDKDSSKPPSKTGYYPPSQALVGILKSAEPTLEEMLNKALKDNPDIKVAEAKLREADAELNRVRLQVTQKVLTFHHTREAQKALVKVAENEVARIRKLPQNLLPEKDLSEAEDRLAQAKAKLAEIEAGMPYLLGQEMGIVLHIGARLPETKSEAKDWDVSLAIPTLSSVQFSPDGKRLLATGVKPVAETTLEKIRKALDTPVTLDYKSKDARQVLEDLEKKVPGISFHVMVNTPTADLHLAGPVSLAAALQLVEDTYMETPTDERCSFAIRDYGILFTGARRIPPGAIQLDNLLKEKAIAERQKAVEERIKKQPEDKKPTSGKH